MTRTYTDATIAAHNALMSAGFFGRVNAASVKAAGLLRELYACADAGLARYDGAVDFGGDRTAVFFYIFLGE